MAQNCDRLDEINVVKRNAHSRITLELEAYRVVLRSAKHAMGVWYGVWMGAYMNWLQHHFLLEMMTYIPDWSVLTE